MTSNTGAIAGGTGGKSVGFPHAGVWIDRTWADNPGITVCNQNVSGNISQGTFRIHGTNATFNSYPFASGADFSVNMQIDGGTYATSDRRSKINVTSITNALDIIGKLDGKRFQRINSMGEVQSHISQNSYKFGFIAQDVQNQGIDELYIYNPADDDGTNNYNTSYCLDYSSLTAVLVNAIKEQNEMIVDLRNRISKLESR
jgi:hypothetical protein